MRLAKHIIQYIGMIFFVVGIPIIVTLVDPTSNIYFYVSDFFGWIYMLCTGWFSVGGLFETLFGIIAIIAIFFLLIVIAIIAIRLALKGARVLCRKLLSELTDDQVFAFLSFVGLISILNILIIVYHFWRYMPARLDDLILFVAHYGNYVFKYVNFTAFSEFSLPFTGNNFCISLFFMVVVFFLIARKCVPCSHCNRKFTTVRGRVLDKGSYNSSRAVNVDVKVGERKTYEGGYHKKTEDITESRRGTRVTTTTATTSEYTCMRCGEVFSHTEYEHDSTDYVN